MAVTSLLRNFVVTCAILHAAIVCDSPASAQPRPDGVKGLPQKHEYQKQLRSYLGTLKESDFAVPDSRAFTLADNLSSDEFLRLWVLGLDPVRIGNKRCAPSVNLLPNQFLLSHIESRADQQVIRPGAWCEP